VRAALARSSVAIVGCGGLGSNAAAMLLRSGVRALTLIDSDVVEPSNLNRQLYFSDQIGMPKTDALASTLRRIDDGVRLTLIRQRMTAENLVGCVSGTDVIIEAVDDAETKAMIVGVCTRDLPDVPLVTASGLAGDGPANLITTERLADNVLVCGDMVSDVRVTPTLLASRVMVAAAHEANAAIRILLGEPEP